jgi:glycosyltransferase involved in cell wall biosynthesis
MPVRAVLGVAPGGVVSGAETVLLRDLCAARDAGWAVRLACTGGPLAERAAQLDLERVPIPDLRLPEGRRASATTVALARAVQASVLLYRATRPGEIIVANGLNTLPAMRPLARRTPIVYFAHDVLVRNDRVALLRLCAPAVRRAIAVSDAVARPLRVLGVDTTVVLNGTPWPVPEAFPPDPSQPAIVGISAVLTPWKGHAVLLEAFARLAHPDARLEIMGGTLPKDAEYAASLRRRATQPDLAGRVDFLGHVERPLERLRTWRVAVSASIDPEAGPLTTLEAMSVGVPLVATDHGGVVEVLGDAGVLVPPHDPDAMARAIDALLGDPDLWARCREAGPRIIVDQRLTLDDHESRWLAALEKVAEEAARR